jgi:hypothetical protein
VERLGLIVLDAVILEVGELLGMQVMGVTAGIMTQV